jgi:hypothetical protein
MTDFSISISKKEEEEEEEKQDQPIEFAHRLSHDDIVHEFIYNPKIRSEMEKREGSRSPTGALVLMAR